MKRKRFAKTDPTFRSSPSRIDALQNKLQDLKEGDLTTRVVIPLLKCLGHTDVIYHRPRSPCHSCERPGEGYAFTGGRTLWSFDVRCGCL